MYKCIYTCIYVYLYTHTYIYIYIYICKHIYTYIYIRTRPPFARTNCSNTQRRVNSEKTETLKDLHVV